MTVNSALRERIAFESDKFRDSAGALRVLLVYKKSRLETFGIETEFDEKELKEEHSQHIECLKRVREFLNTSDFAFDECFRGELSAEKTEGRIILTVGGDGTILDASHFSLSSPVFGINSDPARSVGSLCIADINNFANLLDELRAGILKILPVTRIGGSIDGKSLEILSLNEILVAHKNPAAMSRYEVKIDDKTELHRSSGVWIAAPMGSTGATLSAGGHTSPLGDKRIQMLVREPYFARGKVTNLLSGMLRENQELVITSKMMEGRIFFDGPHKSINFSVGSVLKLNSHGHPLHIFVNDDLEYRRSQIAALRESFRKKMTNENPEFVY